jgi:hypothetical protein
MHISAELGLGLSIRASEKLACTSRLCDAAAIQGLRHQRSCARVEIADVRDVVGDELSDIALRCIKDRRRVRVVIQFGSAARFLAFSPVCTL